MIRSLDFFWQFLNNKRFLKLDRNTHFNHVDFLSHRNAKGRGGKKRIASQQRKKHHRRTRIPSANNNRQGRKRGCEERAFVRLVLQSRWARWRRMNIQGKKGRHPSRQWWEFITKQLTPNEWYSFILIRCFVAPFFFSGGAHYCVFFNPARLLIYRGCWIGLCPCAEKKC
jgi:hypothetical protein